VECDTGPEFVAREHNNITINEEEIYWANGSLRVSHQLGSRSTCQFRVRAEKGTPQIGQSIGVYDHAQRIFGGTVESVTLSPIIRKPGCEAWYDVIGTGWEQRLERHKIEAMAFSGKTAGEIVDELIDYVWLKGEFMSKGTIEPGASAEELGAIIFRGMSVWSAIQELAQRSNFLVFVDMEHFLQFVPRTFLEASIQAAAWLKNYRRPQILIDRSDYYNAASIAISLDAYDPLKLNLAGDITYPFFDVYDPDDDLKTPLPIEAIRRIEINGVEQSLGLYTIDDDKVFYWRQGSSTIHWDLEEPPPSPDDIITIEFWYVRQNVITIEDTVEQEAVATIEGAGSGRYHAFFEDLEETDITAATARLTSFLNDHIPARNFGEPGEMPREYGWDMFTHELVHSTTGEWTILDLIPGRKITFNPSTPEAEEVGVIIQSLEVSDTDDPLLFRYQVSAAKHVPLANDMDFYQALAEVPIGEPEVDDGRLRPDPHIIFEVSGTPSTGVIQSGGAPLLIEIDVGPGRVFRCLDAAIVAGEAPASLIQVDLEYSTDSYDTAYASRTWNPVFLTSDGELQLPAAQLQMEEALGKFAGWPDTRLDLPHKAMVRCDIKAASGKTIIISVRGEIREAEPVVVAA
jgi:hypothetical protein